MAQMKTVQAAKACTLDCGHHVNAGAELVIISFFTTPQVAPLVKAAVMGMVWALNPPSKKTDQPVNTKQPHSPKK
jgi:hypothetical protein